MILGDKPLFFQGFRHSVGGDRGKLATEQVHEFCILVLVQLILILALLHSIASFMFLKYPNFSPFINYFVIITSFFDTTARQTGAAARL
jgi:hypothetical protein